MEEAQPMKSPPNEPSEVMNQQKITQDFVVLRLAVVGLMLAIGLGLVGAITLVYFGKHLPEGVIAITSAATGALATMLVRTGYGPNGG